MYNGTKMLQVGVSKSLLKEYKVKNDNRVVYLKNEDEFQLQIFNPTTFTVAAEIYLNGTRIPSKLILRPGERIWLERYLDRTKKFKFETYEADGSTEMQSLIDKAKNGVIQVKFYKEDTSISTISAYPAGYSDSISEMCYYSNSTSPAIDGFDPATTKLAAGENVNYWLSGSIEDCCSYSIPDCDAVVKEVEDTIETGRIEEGGYSSQEFDHVNKNFSTWSFNTETIKILPVSQKPVSVNDLQKRYCPECGHRLKNNYKFCPYCGSKIEE